MSTTSPQSTAVVWEGRPWIIPNLVARTILVIIFGAVIVWLESLDNAAHSIIFGNPVWTWTILLFLMVWGLSLIPLVVLRAAHKYTL